MEYPAQRFLRDVRFTLIGGGTSEILKLIIAKEISDMMQARSPSSRSARKCKCPTFTSYAAPRSLDEAAEILRAANVTILAGGTDLMPQSKTGKLKFQPTLMNISASPSCTASRRATAPSASAP